jgi:hypothetical protein
LSLWVLHLLRFVGLWTTCYSRNLSITASGRLAISRTDFDYADGIF